MTFRVVAHGTVFSTRDRGEKLLEEVDRALADGEDLVVDFDGVLSISHSFADEFIGALFEAKPGEVTIENAAPSVERAIQRSLRARGHGQPPIPA
jgi:STAS-like domain of unknown function (DUF4325)